MFFFVQAGDHYIQSNRVICIKLLYYNSKSFKLNGIPNLFKVKKSSVACFAVYYILF